MNAYYKETEKPFGYLLVDIEPDTPADKQILADLFGECYVYHFGVNNTESKCVETKLAGRKRCDHVCHLGKKVNSTKFAKRDYSPGRKLPTQPNWSEASYWPVKIKHKSSGRTKWVNLHEDEPTVRAFVKEPMAMEN